MPGIAAGVASVAAFVMVLTGSPAVAAPAHRPALWTYGYGLARTGHAPDAWAPTAAEARRLAAAWTVRLPGRIRTQPLVARGVPLPWGDWGSAVIVGTERGSLEARHLATGRVIWRRSFGWREACGATGITGTPVL